MAITRSERIRALNDALRTSLDTSLGKIVMTSGVAALAPDVVAQVIRRITSFNAFDADDDPHGEHDFGSFDLADDMIFWKIDYYAPDLQGGSDDPTDPLKTLRVLTIMLAEEY